MSLDLGEVGRFRVNMFRQRQHSGVVIRRINAQSRRSPNSSCPRSWAICAARSAAW